jgi:very-short-patch-repair endonuclease
MKIIHRRASHKSNCRCCVCKLKRGESHNLNCTCFACKLVRGESKGKQNLNYKHGKYIRKRCPICDKLLSPSAKICTKHRIHSIVSNRTRNKQKLIMLKRWKNIHYRDKVIKKWMQSCAIKPNKKEVLLNTLLQQILPKEYKYVGDGQVIIDGFNPDFINCNGQKKIIEMFGDYWHNKSNAKEKDKRRLEAYKTYGYKTLIVWEHELNNFNKLVNKIDRFTLRT